MGEFSLPPLWNERTSDKKKEKSKSGADYRLARATSLENVRVNDLTGSELGHRAGFAIATRDGLLVYAALAITKSDQGLQAIPLSAFIVKPPQAEWLLDISDNMVSFEAPSSGNVSSAN